MAKTLYRVVCSEERFKDKIYVDIADANGITHEMLSKERCKNNPNISDLAGSIYLTDIDGQTPQLEFTKHKGLPKNNELYKYYMKLYQKLTPLILSTFSEMKRQGRKSTLPVGKYLYSDFYQTTEYPSSPMEERLREEVERKKRIEENKKRTLRRMARLHAFHSPETLMAWKLARTQGD